MHARSRSIPPKRPIPISVPIPIPISIPMVMLVASLVAGALVAGAHRSRAGSAPEEEAWSKDFPVEAGELVSSGRNPYFILEPGYRLVLEDDEDRLVITVLDETRTVDGVQTRVVEERETEDGQLVEVSRNFFAISKRTNSVFYFGEEVDIYRDGKVASHEGAWRSGEDGARFGLMMPGQILLHGRYYQEVAPGVAMDRAEIVSTSVEKKTPAGEWKDCLQTEESSPLEPGVSERKEYARGVGLVRDGSMRLVEYARDASK